MNDQHKDGGAALPQPDLSGTEDFFGLPRRSLVETRAKTYRYEPKCEMPDLIPTAAYVAGLEAALRACVAAIEHADMADGVCCCGDDILYHSSPMSCGHTPTDLGEYNAAMVVAVAEKALSARPDAPDVRTVTVTQLKRLLNTLAELDGHTKLDDEIRDSVIEEIRTLIVEK